MHHATHDFPCLFLQFQHFLDIIHTLSLFRHHFEGPRKIDTGLATVLKDLLVQKLESKKVDDKQKGKVNERLAVRNEAHTSMQQMLNKGVTGFA